jgi:hypothetical protein
VCARILNCKEAFVGINEANALAIRNNKLRFIARKAL